MFGHLPELIIVLVIALIVFGPEKLPEVAGSVGKAVREIRSTMDVALDQNDHVVPDDFATYYREAQMRSGELEPEEPFDYEADAVKTFGTYEDEPAVEDSGAHPVPPDA